MTPETSILARRVETNILWKLRMSLCFRGDASRRLESYRVPSPAQGTEPGGPRSQLHPPRWSNTSTQSSVPGNLHVIGRWSCVILHFTASGVTMTFPNDFTLKQNAYMTSLKQLDLQIMLFNVEMENCASFKLTRQNYQ